jgi:[ribosomal protein S5]-alanine N-acetyltransferase
MEIDCGLCRVRSWRADDRDALVRHADNPKVAANLRDRFPNPYTTADAEAWLKHVAATGPATTFAIEFDGEAVGGIGYEIVDDFDRCSAEVGYWLGETAWGKGIATAALRGVTAHAFAHHDLTRLYAIPFAENVPSRRVLEKAGYSCEGMMRRSVRKRGRVIDAALYAMVR